MSLQLQIYIVEIAASSATKLPSLHLKQTKGPAAALRAIALVAEKVGILISFWSFIICFAFSSLTLISIS